MPMPAPAKPCGMNMPARAAAAAGAAALSTTTPARAARRNVRDLIDPKFLNMMTTPLLGRRDFHLMPAGGRTHGKRIAPKLYSLARRRRRRRHAFVRFRLSRVVERRDRELHMRRDRRSTVTYGVDVQWNTAGAQGLTPRRRSAPNRAAAT